MPRPQTARRLLREMTSMGVESIWMAMTDRSEAGYATSKLWATGEYQRHVMQGAEQAFCTRLPDVRRFDSLADALTELRPDTDRVALDNYEGEAHLSSWRSSRPTAAVALGAERGWTAAERDLLRTKGFGLFDLGERVLRVETAAIAAITIVLASLSIPLN